MAESEKTGNELLTVKELAERVKAGDSQLLELGRELDTALVSFSKEDRSFDCRLCGQRFTPAKGQWIFYNLCDACHEEYQGQRPWRGIFPLSPEFEAERKKINAMNVGRFESCGEWVKSKRESK